MAVESPAGGLEAALCLLAPQPLSVPGFPTQRGSRHLPHPCCLSAPAPRTC